MSISKLTLSSRGILKFSWHDDNEDDITLVFYNRLNHSRIDECSFTRREFVRIPATGLDLKKYGIPYNIPLEVVMKGSRNGEPFEQSPDCGILGRKITLTCSVEEFRSSSIWPFWNKTVERYFAVDVPNIPGVDRLREGIIYLSLQPQVGTEDTEVKIYLPALEVGKKNLFEWEEPPGYRLMMDSPRRNNMIPEYNMFNVIFR